MLFQLDPKYDQYIIKEFQFWRLYLHGNQYFPGRMYAAAYRDFIQKRHMTHNEAEELFHIECVASDAITLLTMAPHFNYFWGANEWPHAHSHIIPRYKDPVTIFGHTFKDEFWGQNYGEYPKSYQIPRDVETGILVNLRRHFQRNS